MLSVVICSIDPSRLERLESNIRHTAGVECEIIGIDNRIQKRPIAEVYNLGASMAKFPCLLFVHEDVLFRTQGWAPPILEKLRERDCGVIGFAGGRMKTLSYSGWCTYRPEYDRTWYLFPDGRGNELLSASGADGHPGFAHVVTVDGFAMFSRKDTWQEHPFDERALRGFHCYDLDFSLELARLGYSNYVCQHIVDVMHCSEGCFGNAWMEETIRLHDTKWRDFLPVFAPGFELGGSELRAEEELVAHRFLRTALDIHSPHAAMLFRKFCRLPFSWKHLGHVIGTSWQFVKILFRERTHS